MGTKKEKDVRHPFIAQTCRCDHACFAIVIIREEGREDC